MRGVRPIGWRRDAGQARVTGARYLLLLHRRQIGTRPVRHFRRHADALAERRVRVDDLADIDRVAAHLDGQRHLADRVAGRGVDDGAAEAAVRLVVEDQLGESVVATVGNRASITCPGDLGDLDLAASFLLFGFGLKFRRPGGDCDA